MTSTRKITTPAAVSVAAVAISIAPVKAQSIDPGQTTGIVQFASVYQIVEQVREQASLIAGRLAFPFIGSLILFR